MRCSFSDSTGVVSICPFVLSAFLIGGILLDASDSPLKCANNPSRNVQQFKPSPTWSKDLISCNSVLRLERPNVAQIQRHRVNNPFEPRVERSQGSTGVARTRQPSS
jgi:hypothetical protein